MAKKKKKLTRLERRKRRRRRLLIFEVVLLLVLVAALFVWMKFGMINFDEIRPVATNEMDKETEEMLHGYTNIALFGVDNRTMGDYDSGNSDTIIIASIDNDSKEVRLVSIYRDTMLDSGDGTLRKANYAYSVGGAEGAIAMVNKNLDMDIQDYVAADFQAVIAAVDAVGGIELDISQQEADIMNKIYMPEVTNVMDVTTTAAVPGDDVLVDGVKALCFCRIRYTKGDDFARASRQRIVIGKLMEKAKQANVMELNRLINAVFPYISTSMSASDMISLAKYYQEYEFADTSGFPFKKANGRFGSKGDMVVPCTLESNVVQLYKYLFNEDHTCSQTVMDISNRITYETGFDEDDAVQYEFE